ncbi:Alpha/Beta hydrolase protein [Phascolomyces articulosus]|uniref:Alpha/Beta hydrolase protein n=1 Tax=Phascolomyces articulosus TaxID=60185 RepID=A0AAD5PK16_9FUNG|nr:Alpha/Beta hydrolase protein [Phascolomyces articulosus]
MSSSQRACCTIPPVASNYEPVGTLETIKSDTVPEMSVYVVGPKDTKKAVIVFYDIMGFHNNTKQFCDILAKYCGYKVLLPDFFRGSSWDPSRMTPEDIPKLMAWIGEIGTIQKIRPDVDLLREWLEKQGVIQAGLVGFCWGAKVAIQVTDEGSFFGGAALIHPSMVDIKDAEAATAPVLALPTKDEPDMVTRYLCFFFRIYYTTLLYI